METSPLFPYSLYITCKSAWTGTGTTELHLSYLIHTYTWKREERFFSSLYFYDKNIFIDPPIANNDMTHLDIINQLNQSIENSFVLRLIIRLNHRKNIISYTVDNTNSLKQFLQLLSAIYLHFCSCVCLHQFFLTM